MNILLTVAILCTSLCVYALSTPHIARHHHIARQNVANNTNSSSGRCKSRPPSSSAVPSAAVTPYTYAPPSPSPTLPSSSAPSPSPPPSSSGSKTGLAWAMGDTTALKNIVNNKMHFMYNWGVASSGDTYGLEFCHMFWGAKDTEAIRSLLQGSISCLLGFNEPEIAGQSAMDPTDAANLWMEVVVPIQDTIPTLLTPAITSDSYGLPWLNAFMKACKNCKFTASAYHFYGTKAEDFVTYVTTFHNTFNLPVWVTEFAAWDFSGQNPQLSQGEVDAFMQTVTEWMDNTSFVEQYFAYGFVANMGNVGYTCQLMDGNGALTPLGEIYINN